MRLLNEVEVTKVEERITQFELKTKGELRIALLESSDKYSGASYRQVLAYALFICSLVEIFLPLSADHLFLLIIGVIVSLILLIPYLPFKALFITRHEKAEEVKEKALSLFFTQGLSQTENRIGMLLMISILERKIELIVDKTILEKFGQAELDLIVSEIGQKFRAGQFTEGLAAGIAHIELELLKHFPNGVQMKKENELSNKLIIL